MEYPRRALLGDIDEAKALTLRWNNPSPPPPLSRRCSASASTAGSRRFAWESEAGASSSSPSDVAVGLLLFRCGSVRGCYGWWLARSGSFFPRWLWLDGEHRSGSGRSWGVVPVDGRQPLASTRLLHGCLLRLHFKARVRLDFSSSLWCSSSSSVAVVGDEVDDRKGIQKDPRASL
jgi:hypothetical protein